MNYTGKDKDGWHFVEDGGTTYAVSMCSELIEDNPEARDRAVVLVLRDVNHWRWDAVDASDIRKQVIMTAWPMVLEE